jgi:hypothetical protein
MAGSKILFARVWNFYLRMASFFWEFKQISSVQYPKVTPWPGGEEKKQQTWVVVGLKRDASSRKEEGSTGWSEGVRAVVLAPVQCGDLGGDLWPGSLGRRSEEISGLDLGDLCGE